MKATSKKSNAAFTLVEMMIVMGILGVLAAITIPNFIKARSSGHRSVCIANLKQIQDAKITWSMENNKGNDDVPLPIDLYGTEKYLRQAPFCPSEGLYNLRTVGETAACSRPAIEGHTL